MYVLFSIVEKIRLFPQILIQKDSREPLQVNFKNKNTRILLKTLEKLQHFVSSKKWKPSVVKSC